MQARHRIHSRVRTVEPRAKTSVARAASGSNAARVEIPQPERSIASALGKQLDSRAVSATTGDAFAAIRLENGVGAQAHLALVQHLQRTHGNHAVQRMIRGTSPPPFRLVGKIPNSETITQSQVTGAQSARTQWRPDESGGKAAGSTIVQRFTFVERLSVGDVIPDAILDPIKSLVGQVTGFGSGLTSKSDTAASGTQSEADTAAEKVDGETDAKVSTEQAKGEAAATRAQTQAASAEASAQSAQVGGQTQAAQITNALPAAEYASDPVKPTVQAPPAGKLPGGGQAAGKGAAETWNCDEASILNKVSSVGKGVIQGLTKVVKAIVPESVLQFAQQGVAKLQTAMGTIKQKVEAAKQAVTQWMDNRLKPIRDAIHKAEQVVSDKINAAKQAISEKISQATAWASAKWTALKTKVTTAVNGAIEWAKSGVGGLVDKAKSLAGRFWNMLPDWIKGPLTGAAAALAAPIVLAYKAIETSAAWVEKKAAWVKERLGTAANKATKWLGEKYQKVRGVVVRAGEVLGKGMAWVKKKAADAGRFAYDGIDKLSGGRISKWRAAAAARFAELKGKVCAITGAAAGPCVERFVPEPVGEGKSFASLTTKTDLTVPVEGVPVKVAAGAKITIERTAKKYNVTLSGEGFAGVAIDLSGGGGGGGASGSLTVDGTLPNKALALLSLSSQSPGLPGVPIPIGGGPKPAAGASALATPAAATPAVPSAAGAGGGAVSASAEVGKQVSVALTYSFDATADKATCDGLGGLTAFLASQGAAALLPEPFSHLAAVGGQAAFADKLTSAKVTFADTGAITLQGGQGAAKGSVGVKSESGVSIETKTADGKKSITATLFQALSGDASLNFTPEGIGLGKIGAGLGGRQELAIIYDITLDEIDAGVKQSLSGSATLGVFAGMLGSLPAPVREPIRKLLACLPNANEATVSFELSNNVVNLRALAAALDGELNKGAGASASGVWDAVSGFLKNKDNCYIEFSAKLTLTEKVLGVKASASAGEGPERISGSAELGVSRGQEIVLCPPTRLLQDDGSGAGPAVGVPGAAPPGAAPPALVPRRPRPSATLGPLPFFHGSTWRIAQSIPGHVRPIGGGDFGQGFYTHHDTNTNVAGERARWEGCRLCQKMVPKERYAGVIRFDVAPSDYGRLSNRRDFDLTTTTQPDYVARQKEWLDFVSGSGRGRESCPVYDPAHMSWRHQRVDPPPDQGYSLIEGPMYKGVEGLPGGPVPPRSAFDPYAEGTALPQQVVWNHDQAIGVLNASPTSLKQYDATHDCAPVDPPATVAAVGEPAVEDARAREAAQAEMTGG
jgi:hypothetical protein